MLIGICGGICAGKKTIAQYLVDQHDFQRLFLEPGATAADCRADCRDDSAGDDDVSRRFSDWASMLEFVTKRWQERWVTTEVRTEADVDALALRPFFLLVSVDAPVAVRWRRLQRGTLDEFVTRDDAQQYDGPAGVAARADVQLLNPGADLADLYASLGKAALTDVERLRPSWDGYFMGLASLAARRSNCMKRRVGCVLVGPGRRVLSTGYNGTPRGMLNCADGGCARCNDGTNARGVGLATCLCLHAEENALLEAGRDRIREGAVLYCDTCPCLTCSIKICQVGICEVVFSREYSMDGDTALIFREAGVTLRQFNPPSNCLIRLQ